jgi:hypothetical protein
MYNEQITLEKLQQPSPLFWEETDDYFEFMGIFENNEPLPTSELSKEEAIEVICEDIQKKIDDKKAAVNNGEITTEQMREFLEDMEYLLRGGSFSIPYEGSEDVYYFHTIEKVAPDDRETVKTEVWNRFKDVINSLKEQYKPLPGGSIVANILDGFLGMLLYPLRLIIILLGDLFRVIITGIASIGGTTESGGLINIGDILFNKVPITSLNFFDFSTEGSVNIIRKGVAGWYYTTRNLSIVVSLCILIYTGVRMVISTVAEEKAKYKQLLLNWAIGFIVIFLLNYIIIFTIQANNIVVEAIQPNYQSININQSFTDQLRDSGVQMLSLVNAFGGAILYCILLGITFSFLIMYIKRMINMAILIIISPLITVTYAVDKMGDNKSQALNTWIKEFVYGVIIQPFHCILYLVFVSTSINTLNSAQSLNFGAVIFAVFCMLSLLKSEEVLRKIFKFDQNASTSLTAGLVSVSMLGAGIGKITSMIASNSGNNAKSGRSRKPRLKDVMPKLPNQQAQNSDPTNNGQAPVIAQPIQQASGNQRAGGMQQGPTRGQKAKSIAKKVGKQYINTTAKMGVAIAMASMGGINEGKNALTYGAAGYAAGSGIISKVRQRVEKNERKNNEDIFRQAYKIYEDDLMKEYGSQKKIIEASRELLDLDNLDSISNTSVRQYTEYLQGLRDTYALTGDNKPEKSVIEELKYIQENLKS